MLEDHLAAVELPIDERGRSFMGRAIGKSEHPIARGFGETRSKAKEKYLRTGTY